ncbi:hypothetical protein D0907_11885 [Pseudoalteromonas lipolytica]|uniref:Uncharacterized protein n=1 Tax=Pseudoalteromonas lipolytica TaxID=570156 RepID=A0AAD0WCY0_9GAMM|nr:hypothetical protein [Pseudoalteromonas donghaensis]AXV65918.1 hypothetical protein D0907_11885 [Pseudoalteromonas donghaensis]
MIKSCVNKLIFVDEEFMRELEQGAVSVLEEFNNPTSDTQVIKLPLKEDELTHLVQSMDVSEIKPGNILVKPNYINRFFRIEEFSESHVLRKYRLWTQLCLALGAKHVKVQDIKDVNIEAGNDSDISVKATASSLVAEGSLDVSAKKSSRANEIRQQIMDMSTDAEGSKPDLDAAHRILEKYNLFHDDLFMSVYEMRELMTNSLKRHEFYLDFSSDIKKVFNSSIKAKLDVMAKVYKGRIDFDSQENAFEDARTAMKLSILVEF